MTEEEKNSDEMAFFCKDCSRVLTEKQVERCGKRLVFKTKECGTKNVAFGSKKSIYGFFRVEEMEKKLKKNGGEELKCYNKGRERLREE